MKQIIILITLFATGLGYGQDNNPDNFLSEIKKYNISDLWTLKKFETEYEHDTSWIKRAEPLGYIGESYQRFYIHFISVIQNPYNKLEYMVYGKTRVKTNICSFLGILRIEVSKIYKSDKNPDIKHGYVEGDYEFFEDSEQKSTGILKGKFMTEFYIDKTGQIKYNSLSYGSDGFENNQFEGSWTSYKLKDSKKCNWGDYRIPDSKDLDCGAAEFGPHPKYDLFGWDSYSISMGIKTGDLTEEEARIIENEKWWMDKK